MATIKLHFPTTLLPVALDCNNDRMFHAWQALCTQAWLDADDRQRVIAESSFSLFHDETDARAERLVAMNEWSKAVRNGFVCC